MFIKTTLFSFGTAFMFFGDKRGCGGKGFKLLLNKATAVVLKNLILLILI